MSAMLGLLEGVFCAVLQLFSIKAASHIFLRQL